MKKTPEEALAQYWGFTNFRPKQKEIIFNLLQGKNALALLPTGGGKSLCYQLPAVLNDGIAIVISPLLSLMKDQVMQLNERGIKALYIPGGAPYNEVDTLLDNCIYGNYKLLYLSPERLLQDLVVERIDRMNVSLIAIDEAHCISQWGHDFRPAYRNLKIFRERYPDVACLALTATATQKVITDIKEQLLLENATVFQNSFARPNLQYWVQKVEDKYYYLERLFKKETGAAIVYVRSRKSAYTYTEVLNHRGIKANFYHGGMGNDARHTSFIDWMQNKTQVMVATSAFGMGIDKPDVKTVVHVELPDSLESYFQEAGRAGRDGKKATSVILHSESDKDRLHNQFLRVIPKVSEVRHVYKKLNSYFQISYGEGDQETFRFDFSNFCKSYDLNTILTYNALQLLDRNSVLTLSQEFYRTTRLLFKVSPVQLTYYLIKNPGLDRIVKTILRTYGGIFDQEMRIDLALISKKSNQSVDFIHDKLVQLNNDNIAEYEYTSFDTSITMLTAREDELVINRIAKDIKAQNQRKIDQIHAMTGYIDNHSQCRSIQLLAYFNETKSVPCGICDVCRDDKKFRPTQEEMSYFIAQMLKVLKNKPLTSREWQQQINGVPNDLWVTLLQDLLEQKRITLTVNNKYRFIK